MESGFWPGKKRLVELAREADSAMRVERARALPSPGSAKVVREFFLNRCARLGYATGTMRELGDDNFRPLFEAHMRDAITDADLVAGLRRLSLGHPLRPRHESRPPAQLIHLADRLKDQDR